MTEIKRQSPVQFKVSPRKTEVRDNWTVTLEYDEEGQGPWLVDLAHKTRWDLQDSKIGDQRPCDLAVPADAGACTFANDTLINRMNRTQTSIYHLGTAAAPVLPDFAGYTDVTESTVFLALFGPKAFFIAEKLTALDFLDPAKQAPFLYQGPFCHVPCQIVTLEKAAEGSGGFLLTCSRGYGDSMVHAIIEAGSALGLRPAGENRFTAWIQALQG
ncbi:sarcosine oxidase subunit gamma SoxG [Desulfosarcina sp.]|uniref:sarcosine oxidase subunit gamma SoxG n=1 Tax=Desulfosarcina sp. TaxID=2027861 RepID=UPI0039705D56